MADDIPPRIAALEQMARHTQATLDRIETRLDRIDARLQDNFQFLVRLHIGQLAALASGFVVLAGLILHLTGRL